MIKGFSKLSPEDKTSLIQELLMDTDLSEVFNSVSLENKNTEKIIRELSENVLAVFPLPYSIVPNFKIDGKDYFVPMVTEESSVVAAAAKSAGYWNERGGFHTEIISTVKTGQIHFKYNGRSNSLKDFFNRNETQLLQSVALLDTKMKHRGGGIKGISLLDQTIEMENYYQIHVDFDTCDAMGANYMNSCLETIAKEFNQLAQLSTSNLNEKPEIIISILSNYSPESAVKVWVECPVRDLDDGKLGFTTQKFAERFQDAVKIAEVDVRRAVTHNKGFYNGIDAVALATGNDWRAIEANGHAYASESGKYKSVSRVVTAGDVFRFEAKIPLQVGTVGGITNLHPMTKLSLEVLKNPSANTLMRIIASVGLASNFAAVRSLITTGIQKGHMKMHLSNILMSLNATEEEKTEANRYFAHQEISHSKVVDFILQLRG
jgi:hydroxymethylglutaryl-CoA reductase